MQFNNTINFIIKFLHEPYGIARHVNPQTHSNNGPAYSQRRNVIHLKILGPSNSCNPFESMSFFYPAEFVASGCIIPNYSHSESVFTRSTFVISASRSPYYATYQRCMAFQWNGCISTSVLTHRYSVRWPAFLNDSITSSKRRRLLWALNKYRQLLSYLFNT
jgi:hypothetical protein